MHLYKHIQSSLLKWIGFGKLKVPHNRREQRTVWCTDYGVYYYRCHYNAYVYLQRLLARLSLFSWTTSLTPSNNSLLPETGLSKLCRSITSEDMHERYIHASVFMCKHTYTFPLDCFLSDYGIFVKQEQNGYQLFYGSLNFPVLFIHTRFWFFSQTFFVRHKRNGKYVGRKIKDSKDPLHAVIQLQPCCERHCVCIYIYTYIYVCIFQWTSTAAFIHFLCA